MSTSKEGDNGHLIARNRRARFDYQVAETLEAGLVLRGAEVKSLRHYGVSLADVYAGLKGGEFFLFNFRVRRYGPDFEPRSYCKLLLHKREKKRLIGFVKERGMTLLALELYFNRKGRCKVKLGLGKGRKTRDKRELLKKRDLDREMRRQSIRS